MTEETVWVRHPRVLETEMGTEISLYDPEEERVTVLNTTASDIWRLLDGNTRMGELIDLLARAYGTEPSSIEGDVTAAVEKLAEEDLIERTA